jgi:DNA-binding IclR family transcriptional regulator
VLSTVASTSPIEIGVRPGSELSFKSSAQGRVLLAFSLLPFQHRVLSRPLERLTAKTIVDRSRLEDELARIVKLGYASAPEQSLLGINAVAAPIFDETDRCVASVALVGSIQFLPERPTPSSVLLLKQTADHISRKLGHRRGPDVSAPPRHGRSPKR